MDLGEKLASLENQIYNDAVTKLQKAEIPPTVGRTIMGNVYMRFVESAYFTASHHAELLAQENAALREQLEDANEASEEESSS